MLRNLDWGDLKLRNLACFVYWLNWICPSNKTSYVEICLVTGNGSFINEAASFGAPVELPTVGRDITVANMCLSISVVLTGVLRPLKCLENRGHLQLAAWLQLYQHNLPRVLLLGLL